MMESLEQDSIKKRANYFNTSSDLSASQPKFKNKHYLSPEMEDVD